MADRDSPSTSSLSEAYNTRPLAGTVRTARAAPPPEQWTLVKELNMETREPCEIWRSGVNHQLFKMQQQLSSCSREIKRLEADLAQDRQNIISSRQAGTQSYSSTCSSSTST